MVSGSFSRRIFNRLQRVTIDRQRAEATREAAFADTSNVYRDLRDNGNGTILEPFRRRNRIKLFFATGIIYSVLLHFLTGLSFVFWLVVCVPTSVFFAYYNERQREAAKKRPILRHYD